MAAAIAPAADQHEQESNMAMSSIDFTKTSSITENADINKAIDTFSFALFNSAVGNATADALGTWTHGLIDELHAELTSDDRQTAQEAARLCRALSLRAAERLGLIVTGIQPATVPQVAMSSITILKGAGVVGKGDAGITAETTE
jgi:hypothetical protein